MSRAALPTCQGSPRCPLGSPSLSSAPVACRSRILASSQRQLFCPGLGLLTPQPGRRGCLRLLASAQKSSEQAKGSLWAPLPQWCHRLAGAFVLVPFLLLGGHRHAVAQPVRISTGAEPFHAASMRPNPLYETSASDLRTSPQVRTVAALAAAMVGYGFVRSGGAGAGSGGSLRSVLASATALGSRGGSATLEGPPRLPSNPGDQSQRLCELYQQIEALRMRNELILGTLIEYMEKHPSSSVEQATEEVMKSLELDASEASSVAEMARAVEAATAAVSGVDTGVAASSPPPPPSRPSGGASRSVLDAATSSIDVTAVAAASVAAAVEAGVPLRPSGGAARLVPPPLDGAGAAAVLPPSPSDTRVPPVPIPERPGGASARNGALVPPPAVQEAAAPPPPPPAPSEAPEEVSGAASHSPPGTELAAWATQVLDQAASPSGSPSQSPQEPPLESYGKVYSNPVATETLRPSMKPTRRAPQRPQQRRTYRAITPLPMPERVNPSFDVAPDSPRPEDYLKEVNARTADGRVNPSFATAESLPGLAAAAAPAASPPPLPAVTRPPPPAPPVVEDPEPPVPPPPAVELTASTAAPAAPAASAAPAPIASEEPVWYNPLSWFTASSGNGLQQEPQRSGVNPSFDASLAVDTTAAVAAAVAVDATEPVVEQPQEPQLQQLQQELAAVAVAEAESEYAIEPEVQLETVEMEVTAVAEEVAAAAEQAEEELEQGGTLVESLVAAAEEQAEATGVEAGVGAAAVASSAAWTEALTGGAAPGDFGPVEQVVELLEVATKTAEYSYPRYDPLRNFFSDFSAPTGAHKYDMLRGLLRAGREEKQQAEQAVQPVPLKYDLIYDLLQSVRTSGDPAAIMAATDPKYDPVWSLLNMGPPTQGSLSKYDMVGALLQAALAASPQPSRYDPLQVVLQAKPVTGSFKYCIAEVLLRGGWQQPLDSGLSDLPAWDPVASILGKNRAGPRGVRRRTVNKYDMVGQALDGLAALPEDLASGRWAAAQPKDLFFSRRQGRRRGQRQPPSKYDMVGQALEAAAALPDELSSGRWAAAQGRELFVDTMERTAEEGGWGLVQRLRDGTAEVVDTVASAVAPVSNLVSKAMGMPYEVAPGVTMAVERPRGTSPRRAASPGAGAAAAAAAVGAFGQALIQELPPVLYQFRMDKKEEKAKKKASSAPVTVAAAQPAARTAAPAVGRRRQRVPPVGPLSFSAAAPAPAEPVAVAPAAAVAEQPAAEPIFERLSSAASQPPSQRFERAVVPPLRGRRGPSEKQLAAVPMPFLPYVDNEALRHAMAESEESSPSDTQPAGRPSAFATTAEAARPPPPPPPAASEPAVFKPEQPPTAAVPEAAEPWSATSMRPSDMAVDLLVVISTQGARSREPPSLEELVARFGAPFLGVAAQLRALRRDAALLRRHPPVERLVRAASNSPGDGKGMWSHLYDMLGAVRDAELAMPGFLRDCRTAFPEVHALLSTGDAGQGVSVLCALCNLVPPEEEGGSRQPSQAPSPKAP